MNLIIDIGNTLAKLVAFDGDTPVEEIKTSNETLERLPEFVNKYAFKQGIVGSVFGITAEAERQLKRLDFPLLYFPRVSFAPWLFPLRRSTFRLPFTKYFL